MSSNRLNSMKQKPRNHRWTRENRIVLALLCRRYNFTTENRRIVAIWNDIFRNELLEERVPEGKLTFETIRSQKAEMLRIRGTGSDVWNEVSQLPLEAATQIFSTQNALIEIAERELIEEESGMVPMGCAEEDERSDFFSEPSTGVIEHHGQSDGHARIEAGTPSLSPIPHQEIPHRNGLGQILRRPISRPFLRQQRSLGQWTVKCPTLLFRGFQCHHGLRARRFIGASGTLPGPPPYNTKFFAKEVAAHLEGKISYNSPFMSLAQNPMNALKWVQQGRRDFAVLLVDDVIKDAETRYGDVGSPYPYLAYDVIHRHELLGLPRGYEGYGEVRIESESKRCRLTGHSSWCGAQLNATPSPYSSTRKQWSWRRQCDR